jgi:hypothetical protein
VLQIVLGAASMIVILFHQQLILINVICVVALALVTGWPTIMAHVRKTKKMSSSSPHGGPSLPVTAPSVAIVHRTEDSISLRPGADALRSDMV